MRLLLIAAATFCLATPARATIITFTYTGAVQSYTATVFGQYEIYAYGASGGNSGDATGGAGAFARGFINLFEGDELRFFIGSRGGDGGGATAGGGGGGTAIARELGLVVGAGGGGGAGNGSESESNSGDDGGSKSSGSGGGAGLSRVSSPTGSGGGGGGYLGAGSDGTASAGAVAGQGGAAFIDGAGGGGGAAPGGFGGGGGGGTFGGGGGGGATGGGGGLSGGGGGGGSYVVGYATSRLIFGGFNVGDGYAVLVLPGSTEPRPPVPSTVVEPASATLFAAGCLALLGLRRRIRAGHHAA